MTSRFDFDFAADSHPIYLPAVWRRFYQSSYFGIGRTTDFISALTIICSIYQLFSRLSHKSASGLRLASFCRLSCTERTFERFASFSLSFHRMSRMFNFNVNWPQPSNYSFLSCFLPSRVKFRRPLEQIQLRLAASEYVTISWTGPIALWNISLSRPFCEILFAALLGSKSHRPRYSSIWARIIVAGVIGPSSHACRLWSWTSASALCQG